MLADEVEVASEDRAVDAVKKQEEEELNEGSQPLDNLEIISRAISIPSKLPQDVQRKWLSQMEEDEDLEITKKNSSFGNKLSSLGKKLKAAGSAVIAANFKARRRFANGSLRPDVRTGAEREEQAQRSSCGASTLSARSQRLLANVYINFGRWLVDAHQLAIIFGLLILLSGLPGTAYLEGKGSFLWFKVDTDPSAFTLTSTQAYKEYDGAIKLNNGSFHPQRSTLLVLSPRDQQAGDRVLSWKFMNKALEIVNDVYATTHVDEATGVTYGFADLCALSGDAPVRTRKQQQQRPESPADIALCASRGADVFSAVEWNRDTLLTRAGPNAGAAQGWTDYAVALYRAAGQKSLPLYGTFNASGFYNAALQKVNTTQDYRRWQPTTLQIPLHLEYFSDVHMAEIAIKWEAKVAQSLTRLPLAYKHNADIKVSCVVESASQDAMQQSLYALTPCAFVTIAVMVLYSSLFLSTQVRTSRGYATQFSLILQGSLISTLAAFSALGWMHYFGLRSINILCVCAAFLVSALGTDCAFIFVSAMKAAGADMPLREAVPMAMAEGASAITVTSLTSAAAFLVSAAVSSSQPAFLRFNLTMAVALILNFFGFVVFFAGCQVENEFRILRGRGDFAFWKTIDRKKLPAWMDVATKLRLRIVMQYSPGLVDGRFVRCKAAGLAVLLVTLVISCACVAFVGVGMPDEYLLPDSSYLHDLSRDFASLTDSSRTTSVSMMVEHLDLMEPSKLGTFLEQVMEPLRMRDDVLTTSCLPAIYAGYTANQASENLNSKTWKAWLDDTEDVRSRAAKSLFGKAYFGEETGQYSGQTVPRAILCSITGVEYSGGSSLLRINAMKAYRSLAATINSNYTQACSPCDETRVTFFSREWAFKTGLDEELPSLCWRTVGFALLAVGLALVLALPFHRALASVINVFLVVFALLGFMGCVGITYNLISYCTITIAIGFSVVYIVPLMHFSVLGEPDDRIGARFSKAIQACGYDVLHGSTATIVGAVLLGFSGAAFARLFSVLTAVVCLYGGAYALWCFPSSMVLVDMSLNKHKVVQITLGSLSFSKPAGASKRAGASGKSLSSSIQLVSSAAE